MARPRPPRPRPRKPLEPEMPPHEVAQLRAELEARLDRIRRILHFKRRVAGPEALED